MKSINDDASTKKLNVSPNLGGSGRSAVSSRRFNIALIKPTFTVEHTTVHFTNSISCLSAHLQE